MWTCIEESVNDNGAMFQTYVGKIGDPMRMIVYSPEDGVTIYDANGRESFGRYPSIEAACRALPTTVLSYHAR